MKLSLNMNWWKKYKDWKRSKQPIQVVSETGKINDVDLVFPDEFAKFITKIYEEKQKSV